MLRSNILPIQVLAKQTCLTLKVLFGRALGSAGQSVRQGSQFGRAVWPTTGFVESLPHPIALDRAVPDFSTLSRRQKTLKVSIP